MMAKFSPCSRSRCAILLAIFALLTCVGAVSVASESNVAKPKTLDRALGRQLRGFQGYRSLRTFLEATKDDDDSEERVFNEFAKKMAQAAKNKLTSNNQATTNKLFKNLQVEETGKELFQSAQFEKWATTVAKNFKKNPEQAPTSMASALVGHYGDEALAALLVTAKQDLKSRIVAIQLQKAQLQNWESAGKTGDDIFKLLKLNGKGENLFETPLAPVWMSYVTQLNKENPGEVIFSSLKKLYSNEVLAKMIVGAKNSASTIVMADKLELLLLNRWLREGKTVDDIFTLLKLNKDGEKLLQSPMLRTWISYVRWQSKDPYGMILVKLLTYYDEPSLAKILIAAQQDDKTSRLARKLEEVLLINWRSDGKTADDVFKLLLSNKDGGNVLENPMLRVWMAYLTKLDKENADKLMFVVLKKHYGGDEGVAKMVTAANK